MSTEQLYYNTHNINIYLCLHKPVGLRPGDGDNHVFADTETPNKYKNFVD
jgi:hypothetical protein